MKNTKKFLSVILALIMTVSCFAFTAIAETTALENDFDTFEGITEENTVDKPSLLVDIGSNYTLSKDGSIAKSGTNMVFAAPVADLLEQLKNGEITGEEFMDDAYSRIALGSTIDPLAYPERNKTKIFPFILYNENADGTLSVIYDTEITVSGTYSNSDKTAVISSITVEEDGAYSDIIDYSIDMSQRMQGKASVTFSLLGVNNFVRFDFTLATNGNLSYSEVNLT